MNRLISGAEIVYKSLLHNNVRDVFVYSGGSVMPIIDKLYKSEINYYINSNEQNIGHAATGYAKSSNRTGVAIVTSGPGITNIITPMLDATNDSTPLVVISGQVSKSAMGTNAFQEAPAIELSKHVTKWSVQPQSAYELAETIDKAFFIANDKKKGVVHIDIPKCVSSELINNITLNKSLEYQINAHSSIFFDDNIITKNIKENNTINSALNKINRSKKPIIMVGQGCIPATQLLTDFVNKSQIPVTTTIHGCGVLDEHHDLSLRWCGMHGYAPANFALQEADCIIALGSRFDDRTTGNLSKYAPNAFKNEGIIHVNIEPTEINKVVKSHYNFNMDCSIFLTEAIKHIKAKERPDWKNTINNWKDKYQFRFPKEKSKERLNMEYVLDSLYRNTLSKDVLFTTGVGNHQMQAYQFIKSQYPKKILSSGSLGVMGASLPYSVGAQIAYPNKLVVAIDGDSSFNMTCTDMKTIKENNLPIKIAIMNNNAQMMVTIWERLYFEERYTATINNNNPDFSLLAESYGIKGLKCDNYNDLEEKVKEFIEYDGPILCEFDIERDICLPLVGPGNALDDMILPEEYNYNSAKDIVMDGLAPS
jgi:acetolactate synthase I/II/III large subunit